MSATLTTPRADVQMSLFGEAFDKRPGALALVPIVSKKDPDKVLGRRVTFDVLTLAEFKEKLAKRSDINAAEKKKLRQEFLNKDAIGQRQMLAMAAVQAAMQPDEFAPAGRVPDSMELRANGTLKFVSVDKFLGTVKETEKQKITRLEKELAALKAAASTPAVIEAETLTEAEIAEAAELKRRLEAGEIEILPAE